MENNLPPSAPYSRRIANQVIPAEPEQFFRSEHRLYTEAGCLILVASPSERQSAELRGKGRGCWRSNRERGDGDNPISIELPNGSRIAE